MEGSRLGEEGLFIDGGGATFNNKERAKTASGATGEFSLQQLRPPPHRPGHPLSLISFPSQTPITLGSKVFGPISPFVAKEEKLRGGPEGKGSEGGWNSQSISQVANKNSIRVPKPSQSAKKLAKPSTTILLPHSASSTAPIASGIEMNAEGHYGRRSGRGRGGVPFKSDYYDKAYVRNRMQFSKVFLGQEKQKEENSPSASSNNIIDNKIGNKPRRNKTAYANTLLPVGLGLRKGITSISANAQGFKGNKKVVNSAGAENPENSQQIGQEEQSEFKNMRVMSTSSKGSGTQGSMVNILSKGNGQVGSMSQSGGGGPMFKLNERLQVNRSEKEREESPESIRLDGMGLKVFPFIGGGEGPSLKLLSLQHNLITRLENVPCQLNHLVVLDLYDNRLERITGLQGFTSLRVLLLGKNRIRRIEGLDGLKRLEILDLHGNQLRYVDNLGALSSLRILNLAGNLLRSVRNLGPYGLSSLTELNLKRNRIRNLDGLVKAPHLKKLLLANNDLQSLGCLFPLRKLVFLQELLLDPNPLCSGLEWKSQVLTVFPWLITLDRFGITDLMRLEARQWHKKKLAEDEERRKEEARLRLGSPTGGPPGSREQAIYQARRRWESVKNFVKNTNSSSKPTNPSSSGGALESTSDTIGMIRDKMEGDDVGCTQEEETLLTCIGGKSPSIIINEQEGKEVLEYPGGEIGLNLAQLDLDLDQASKEVIITEAQPSSLVVLVSSSVVPGDPCPPSRMINDLKATHQGEDYVNSNPTSNKTNNAFAQEEVGLSSEERRKAEAVLLSSQTRTGQMETDPESGIITNTVQKEESFVCQQTKGDDSSSPRKKISDGRKNEWRQERYEEEDEDEDSAVDVDISTGVFFLEETSSLAPVGHGSGSVDKSMRIAVVRPLVRESNVDETFPTHQLNTNLSPSTNNRSGGISNTNTTTHVIPEDSPLLLPQSGLSGQVVSSTGEEESSGNHHLELKKSQCNNNEDEIKWVSRGSNDMCDLIDNDHSDKDKDRCCMSQSAFENKNNTVLLKGDDSNLKKVNCASESKKAITFFDVGGGGGGGGAGMKMTMSDADFDKIINSSKNESMGFSNHKKRNVLRRTVSTSLMPSELQNGQGGQISCATFPTEEKSTCNCNGESETMNMNNRESEAVVGIKIQTEVDVDTPEKKITNVNRKPQLRNLRIASFDGRLPSSQGEPQHLLQVPELGIGPPPPPTRQGESDDDYYYDDDDTCSIATSTNTNTTGGGGGGSNDVSPRTKPPAFLLRNKQLFPRTKSQRQRLRERIPRIHSSSSVTSRKTGQTSLRSGETGRSNNNRQQQQMRRCDSAVAGGGGVTGGGGGVGGTSSSSSGPLGGEALPSNNNSSVPLKKQGTDYLVEIDGKVLSIYGQGALKHTLTGFPGNATYNVTTAKFHYISYDSIIPYFGKLRQIYPSLEHFQFRANNINTLSQLNALSDLQGLTSLHVAKEGNPLVSHDSCWLHYASYRLSHWGLQNVNGKEVCSEYRGGQTQTASSKGYESLGFLALSCLPQTALTPLAKRLHMLHCFCCCSPSSSSDDSGGKGKNAKGPGTTNGPVSPPEQPSSSSGNICTSWDDDPVLLDVIGKEALVYCPPPPRRALSPATMMEESNQERKEGLANFNKIEMSDGRRRDTLRGIVDSGVEILEKLDLLEKTWPSLMTEIIQEILMDYMFMDNYMKKELKKCQDSVAIALHSGSGGNSSGNKKAHHHHSHQH